MKRNKLMKKQKARVGKKLGESMTLVEQIRKEKYGFITDQDLPSIIAEDRFTRCLVRCGGGRFACSAQDVAHFVSIVDGSDDYVRDVSLLA